MARVFVEARPKGRPESSVLSRTTSLKTPCGHHVLQTFKTQHEAIEWAKRTGHTPSRRSVRHLNDKDSQTIGARHRAPVRRSEPPRPCGRL